MLERYVTVPEELSRISVPEQHKANIEALIETERKLLGYGKKVDSNKKDFLHFYPQESQGQQNLYCIFIDGNYSGYFGNRRGVPNQLVQLRSKSPDSPILVHALGTQVNFELVNKLLLEPGMRYSHPTPMPSPIPVTHSNTDKKVA